MAGGQYVDVNHPMIRRIQTIPLVLLLLLAHLSLAYAQQFTPPRVSTYATDLTGTLSSTDLAGLNARLSDFNKQTSTQVVVLMVPTTEGMAVEEAALSVAEVNAIGRKGKDNGVLLFIAKDDRRIRIEVGYGLEGVLPDALSGQIIRNEVTPHFRRGDYAAGIYAGVDAIMRATRNEYTAEPEKQAKGKGISGIFVILMIILVIFIMNRNRRGPFSGSGPMGRGGGPFIFLPPMGGGWSGKRGGFGGGFGGGGFSGGGGSFGGGGASGSW
jgi:uncharacterized protein